MDAYAQNWATRLAPRDEHSSSGGLVWTVHHIGCNDEIIRFYPTATAINASHNISELARRAIDKGSNIGCR